MNEPLPRAVLAAFKARKLLLLSSRRISNKMILKQCDFASVLLEESLTYNSCKSPNNMILVSIF